MGWASCGTDSEGRPIGYGYEGTCDHDGCEEEIDRGLSYVCGEMHGEDEYSCEKYFCNKHHLNCIKVDNAYYNLCDPCFELIEKDYNIDDETDEITLKEKDGLD